MDLKFDLIGSRIKYYREVKGISQEELGAILDISVRHISAIETGTRGISLNLLVDIANALEVSSDDLLTRNLTHSNSVAATEWYEVMHALDNIVHIGEIALAVAVVEDLDRAVFGERVCRREVEHIRSACRSVDCEEAQACGRNVVEL